MEEEPLLKYTRFNARLMSLLPPGCTITTACVHPKFLAIGTSVGSIHVYEWSASGVEWRRIAAHTGRVNDLCTDALGESLGSASDDGTVVASALLTDERTVHTHHRAVKAVRLVPDFSRNRDRPLMTGGVTGRLYLLRKNWLAGMSERLMHEGEGPIRAIAVADTLVAWANDVGVKVLDYVRDDPVCFVEAPVDAPPPHLCPPRLYWEGGATLLIAWGQHVRVVTITQRSAPAPPTAEGVIPAAATITLPSSTPAATGAGGEAPSGAASAPASMTATPPPSTPAAAPTPPAGAGASKRHRVVCRPVLDDGAAIVGIAPYGDDLALLCYCADGGDGEEGDDAGVQVELRIVAREDGYHLLHREMLPLASVGPASTPADFHLLVDHDDLVTQERLPAMFIVAPQDVVVAQARGPAEAVEWRAKGGRYAEALAVALCHPDVVTATRLKELKDGYIAQLLDADQPVAAAAACAMLFRSQPMECDRMIALVFGEDGAGADVVGSGMSATAAGLTATGDGGVVRRRRDAFAAAALAGVHRSRGPTPPATFLPMSPLSSSDAGGAITAVGGGASPPGGGGEGGGGDEATAAATRAIMKMCDGAHAAMPILAPTSYHLILGHLFTAASPRRYVQAVWTVLNQGGRGGGVGPGDGDGTVFTPTTTSRHKPLVDVAVVTAQVERLHAGLKDSSMRVARGSEPMGGGTPVPISSTLVSGAGAPWDDLLSASELMVELYALQSRFEEAVRVYLDQHAMLVDAAGRGEGTATLPAWLQRSSARLFLLLKRHDLHHIVADKVTQLLAVDEAAAIMAMADRLDVFPAYAVAMQLQAAPAQLLRFLHYLIVHKADAYNDKANATIHDVQLALYFEYDRTGLQAFLERSTNYNLETARALCAGATPAPLYRELVYVLTRMGNPRQALSVLLDKLNDVQGAVRLASTYDDDELWTDLVKRTLQGRDGAVIGALLDHIINSPLNPYRIIDLVPRGVAIPHLQRRLLATLRDRRVHMNMVAICAGMFRGDVMSLIHRHIARQKSGLSIPTRTPCALCMEPVAHAALATASAYASSGIACGDGAVVDDAATEEAAAREAAVASHATIFYCGHAFHSPCLDQYRAKAAAAAAAAAAMPSRLGGRSRSSSAMLDRRGRQGSFSLSNDTMSSSGRGGGGFGSRAVATPTGGLSAPDAAIGGGGDGVGATTPAGGSGGPIPALPAATRV